MTRLWPRGWLPPWRIAWNVLWLPFLLVGALSLALYGLGIGGPRRALEYWQEAIG